MNHALKWALQILCVVAWYVGQRSASDDIYYVIAYGRGRYETGAWFYHCPIRWRMPWCEQQGVICRRGR